MDQIEKFLKAMNEMVNSATADDVHPDPFCSASVPRYKTTPAHFMRVMDTYAAARRQGREVNNTFRPFYMEAPGLSGDVNVWDGTSNWVDSRR
jgi:hypothetical protein